MDDNHFTQLEIPVIDISGLRESGSPNMDEVVRQLGQACRDVGFFYIKHHGIPQDLIQQTFTMVESFFSQPLDK